MEKIFGKLIDNQGRCEHYGSPLDIIANRCGECGKLYACYKCHDELENHSFCAVDETEENTVMCGVCGKFYSYADYKKLCSCESCKSSFNPKCSLHSSIYRK